MRRAVEYTGGPGPVLPRPGTFDGLAERSGFTAHECRLAAATGRLAAIVRVAQRREAARREVLGGLPPVPPVLSGREALARMRLRRLAG